MGMLGTKGCLAASVEAAGCSLLFMNVHLPSGEGLADIEDRKASAMTILSSMPAADEFDFICFFGDVNSRILRPQPGQMQVEKYRSGVVIVSCL